MMLGRPRESAAAGERGLEALRPFGIDSTVLVANTIEAQLGIGAQDEADSASAAAIRPSRRTSRTCSSCSGADLELGRGDFEAARIHLQTALGTLREDRGQGIFDIFLAGLALWERRWTEAGEAVSHALARASSRQAAQLHVWFCAKGVRMPSWQRSRVPAAMPRPSERGSVRQTTSSTLLGVPRRRRRP